LEARPSEVVTESVVVARALAGRQQHDSVMNSSDPGEPASAPKWQRLPGPTQLRLAHLISEHLHKHGSAKYVDLRDHPDFAPWFGSHLGHRGEKRFDRLIAFVKRSQPRKVSQRRVSEPALPQPPAAPRDETSEASPAQQLAHGGAPSFEELQNRLMGRLAQLEVALAAHEDGHGGVLATQIYEKLVGQERATILAIGQLSKQYHDALTTGPMLEAILAKLLPQQAPEKLREIANALSEELQRATGLRAIRKKR
jgi:hypothetical protein